MRLPRIWGTHSHYATNFVQAGDDPALPSENGIRALIKTFINNQGGDLVGGDVVKYDTSADGRIKKTTTDGDIDALGVVVAGTYANGAETPVIIEGYHPAVKVIGAVSRGDYLFADNTDGSARAFVTPSAGAFGRVIADDVGGFAAAIIFDVVLGTGGAGTFTALSDTPADYSGAAGKLVAVNSGATALEFVSPGAGVGEYDPRVIPGSPSAYDDEFNDLSLAAAWTQLNTGAATRSVSETLRKGFLYISNIDGGAGSTTLLYKSYTPGANALTVVARLFGNVRNAGSNQANLDVADASGNLIYGLGMLNGSTVIVHDSGGFRSYNVTYITPNTGEIWLAILRDATTNYQAYVSGDGHMWARLEGANRSGTIGRLQISNSSFTSSNSEAYWDFVRTFNSATLDVGGVSQGLGSGLSAHAHSSAIDGGSALAPVTMLVSTYGRAGSAVAPTNQTAGDWTVERLFVGDAVLTANVKKSQVTSPSTVPGSTQDMASRINATWAPNNTTGGGTGLYVNQSVQPSAANGSSSHYGVYVDNQHDAGAFALNQVVGLFSRVHQNVAASTIADARGYQGQVTASNGTITSGLGILGQITANGGIITEGISVAARRFTVSGTFTTSVGLEVGAAGTVTTDIAIRTLSGDHRFVGGLNLGTNAAPTSGYAFDISAGGRMTKTGSKTLTSTLDSMDYRQETITNNTGLFINAIHIGPTFNGSGDEPIALLLRPFFAPSNAITHAYGASLAAIHNGGTINNDLVGFRPIVGSFSNTGSVLRMLGIRIDPPSFTGSVRPTNAIGMEIQNQGVSGITNSYGFFMKQQSGATNNWEFGIDSAAVDTVSAQPVTYYGRVKWAIPGVGTRYMKLWS